MKYLMTSKFFTESKKYLKKYELLKYDDPKIINDPVFPVIKSFEKLLNKLSELDNQGEIKKYFSNNRMVLKYKKYGKAFWPSGNDIIEFSFTKSKNLDYKEYRLLIQFHIYYVKDVKVLSNNSYMFIFFKELKKLSMLYDDSNYNHNIYLSFSFEDKDFNTIIDFLSNLTEELEFIHDINNFNL